MSVLVVSMLGGQLASSANATTIACYIGHYYHRFDGYHTPYTDHAYDQTYEGVKANITARFGYICDTDTNQNTYGGNFTSAWVMTSASTTQTYAQAGIIRFVNQPNDHLYAEDNDNNAGYIRVFGGALDYADNRTYWVQWVLTGGLCSDEFKENYNTTMMQATLWHPTCDAAMDQPWNEQYLEEALYASTDVNGISSNPTNYTSMQTQSYSTDAYSGTLTGITSQMTNPTAGSDLQTFCTAHTLSCDTYGQSGITSNAFNAYTTNPH